ncbi:hypothetical protein N869_13745 [Cellulomonas bogoriensis 69B4 = DSM 16987]|uniref:Uncharacterized protein n=1 Tax=Cellulomonas bogoriensis 69B4 = DSM 16987 TaxID=1386082 RepID=A0A0A0C248_9CELL|nr:hypothetical protein [Cellulomonas bogoriensis]KGM13484.1 hypothetical protein N869_13745 [Cellulomonas bogoriensis 69B4 = DSM 16987]
MAAVTARRDGADPFTALGGLLGGVDLHTTTTTDALAEGRFGSAAASAARAEAAMDRATLVGAGAVALVVVLLGGVVWFVLLRRRRRAVTAP